ncbi:helix-turn-helix transcriptional regulator [Fluviicola sp.]|uniref:helix-turn-helix domain-containing protein n=1 Tax=Fluviicola sp. TaxID=1917219 RepID=UPI0031D54792
MEYPAREYLKSKIGENVARLRSDLHMSQVDLCYAADIDISTLSRIERGEKGSSFETYYKICKALKVDMHVIFIGTDQK